MKREHSAGGIVINKQKVLLIKAGSFRHPGQSHWKFPKGHTEFGEKTEEAALREVKEETGITAKIVTKVGHNKYTYPFKAEKRFKVVTLFLMEYEAGEPVPQQGEVEEVLWASFEEAFERLNYSADKSLLKKALNLLN